MSQIAFPAPDAGILARADAIRAGAARAAAGGMRDHRRGGRRAFETDALTAYRRLPLAVVLPRTTEEVAAALRFCREQRRQRRAARRRHLAVRAARCRRRTRSSSASPR